MSKKCSKCSLANVLSADRCARCGIFVTGHGSRTDAGPVRVIVRRAIICLAVCMAMIAGFYLSLIASAKSLDRQQRAAVQRAIGVLREAGFANEAFLLDTLTVYRSNDHWLNASVAKENAYAATNFPFEIITLYPDFFTYPSDDVERAAILLHEARHLTGADEPDAYEFVWRNRQRLGWTGEIYGTSPVWRNIRKQTFETVPSLFICEFNRYNDCTETTR